MSQSFGRIAPVRTGFFQAIGCAFLFLCSASLHAQSQDTSPSAADSISTQQPQNQTADTFAIDTLINPDGKSGLVHAGIGEHVMVKVKGDAVLDPARYVLILNGYPLDGLAAPAFDPSRHTLDFLLTRSDKNAPTWRILLGRPTSLHRTVSVAIGEKENDKIAHVKTLDAKASPFELAFSRGSFALAASVTLLLLIGIIVLGKRTNLLRDPLLPQLAQSLQTYSLARCQMAFWLVLIVAAYLGLYALLGDINTINEQSLWLMGISSVTGAGAIYVDYTKDTAVDRANAYLRTLGLNNYDDVQKLESDQLNADAEIARREKMIADNFSDITDPAAKSAALNQCQQDKLTLQSKNYDRQLLLNTYHRTIAPFKSQGFWRDLTTDINGSALHRLQLVCWTLILGFVFVREVWLYLAMPQFSTNLLLLMGISSGGYVGFKYPEMQH